MRQIACCCLAFALVLAPPAAAAPYVSCIDGHIVKTLADCPPIPRHNNPDRPPIGGGNGGLLGGLLGGIL